MTYEQLESMAERIFLLLLLQGIMDIREIDWKSPLFRSALEIDRSDFDVLLDILYMKMDEMEEGVQA